MHHSHIRQSHDCRQVGWLKRIRSMPPSS